jgi:deoxyribodipyrimidine photo-lyase
MVARGADRPSIVWFRQDLRVADHPALAHAAAQGSVVPVFVLDDSRHGAAMGSASRWWLHHSLLRLREALKGLVLLRGEPAAVLPELARRVSAQAVVWNRRYEPRARAEEQAVGQALSRHGVAHESFRGSLLWEPGQIRTLGGGAFKVFTPFWRACLKTPVAQCLPSPRVRLHRLTGLGESPGAWRLLPHSPDWAAHFGEHWNPGEQGARKRLRKFLARELPGYGELRNRPDQPGVSRLSPHLHFGELSPRQIWTEVRALIARDPDLEHDGEKFLTQIGWREFSYQLLMQFPQLPQNNWRPEFDRYPWLISKPRLAAWQRGRTGYPLVDAGMRELWQTGYMHNRVRMVTASFLVKHLRIHWRAGEAWFWDTLVDADLANNAASWQWVAGSGADAAPYFRVFNPVEQGRKFDPRGSYVRRWCPELTKLPDKYLHAPFAAAPAVLKAAGVILGKTYPKPIVDHRAARAAALAGYQSIRKQS